MMRAVLSLSGHCKMLAPLLTVALLVITTFRLPAPIQEVPESPKPAPEQTVKPRPKPGSLPQPKSEASQSATNPVKQKPSSTQSRFAGTWVGTMQTIPWGNWAVVLTVDPNDTTMTSEVNGGKPEVKQTQRNGDMLQAKFPAGLTTITWSLTPQPDGVTARVRMQAFMNDFTAVFHRTVAESSAAKSTHSIPQTTTVATPQTTTATPASPQTAGFPTAIPVPNKPGFVYNPFDPTKKRILDVRGIPAGTKVTVPASGKQFIVP